MAQILPPSNFNASSLRVYDLEVGTRFGRIYNGRYPDPLGIGKSPSRFSDPRRRKPHNRYGVLYLGETVKVCFLEAVLRDQRDGRFGDLPIEESELTDRQYASVEIASALRLVDLRDDGALLMGVPTDVAKASRQSLARKWSLAFHEHPDLMDGIVYPSRLNGHTNLAVFDRAISKLQAVIETSLLRAPGLAGVLNDLKVSILPPAS